MSRQFDHAEAFCLMLYRDDAGNEEWIWNSRDGVTPFCILSRAGLEAQHVEFYRDTRILQHVPAVGDRIFVTLNPARAKEHAERWYDRWVAYEDDALRQDFLGHFPDRELAIANHALELLEEFFPSPDLVEVTEEMRERFVRLSGVAS